ncbi:MULTISPECIES: exodeoxyribonuclease VII small subunit [unclassified Coleofasciculus]|uniref:exodeoxyribonuclease VII small subunit n=1 Tax=unclassified Coleofasciculus TaxID=2692782 RepID=UPI00187EAFEC|nr:MULTISPECIES: exodeoxyribonuclease VII small subunit [unclassified Coleofasciculus]MBE9124986.1 exodeoxyribonuclease VII small subunit [Coleofasciculus sp. LEGE 07081]MBE9148010.1 exodeoxyribonuclease VII small subunit [Coleofasciculus sp. LEGE 07092]
MIEPIPRTNQADVSLPSSWNYEDTVKQVETIIEQIEAGELELADVFEQFSTAVEYLRQCEAFLAQRQQQMDVLIETLKDESDF